MKAFLLLAFLVILTLLLLFRGDIATLEEMDTLEIVVFSGALLLMGAYVVLLFANQGSRPVQALRYLLIWSALIFGLVAGYSYRDELGVVLNRVAGELAPPGQTIGVASESGEQAVRVRRRSDGHFAVRGAINGQNMMMLVDTGASTVVLKPSDAERAGIDTRDLAYTVAVQTANGTTYAAPVRLRTVAVGPLIVRDVNALVSQPGSLNENLLGMSFLRRLQSYEFSKDFLTLRG
jgi:aspartyl protease family protein